MSGAAAGKAKVILPRLTKKQGEYFDFKYGEVQETWVRNREAVGRAPKRKVEIQKVSIPEGQGRRIAMRAIELEEEVKGPVVKCEVVERLDMVMQNQQITSATLNGAVNFIVNGK